MKKIMITTIGIGLNSMVHAVLAAPLQPRAPGGEVAVYWGQNAPSASENNDLSTYCTSRSGIDIVILAFLDKYGGNGMTVPSGTIGQDCSISSSGEGTNCASLASEIETCQANGVKVILSLGGANRAYSLTSQAEAQTIGQNLWDAYGNTSGGRVPRPFGSTFVNGWDFDIESNQGNGYYQDLIATLRSNFASDSTHAYYITGAPQCPVPEPNMGEIVTAAQFDYLWVQFYNNPGCSYPNALNYDDWVSYLSGTPSSQAKLLLGLPASELGATGLANGAVYYQSPEVLARTVATFDTHPNWGGIMMWDAAFSDANVADGCNYAQQAASILKTGNPCGGDSAAVLSTPTTPSPTASPTPTGASSGIPVIQWGQVSARDDPDPTGSNFSWDSAVARDTTDRLSALRHTHASRKVHTGRRVNRGIASPH